MEGLTAWLKQPFSANQDAFKWFLFIGLILVALILWGTILRDVRGIV
jgi:hypothetical protein